MHLLLAHANRLRSNLQRLQLQLLFHLRLLVAVQSPVQYFLQLRTTLASCKIWNFFNIEVLTWIIRSSVGSHSNGWKIQDTSVRQFAHTERPKQRSRRLESVLPVELRRIEQSCRYFWECLDSCNQQIKCDKCDSWVNHPSCGLCLHNVVDTSHMRLNFRGCLLGLRLSLFMASHFSLLTSHQLYYCLSIPQYLTVYIILTPHNKDVCFNER